MKLNKAVKDFSIDKFYFIFDAVEVNFGYIALCYNSSNYLKTNLFPLTIKCSIEHGDRFKGQLTIQSITYHSEKIEFQDNANDYYDGYIQKNYLLKHCVINLDYLFHPQSSGYNYNYSNNICIFDKFGNEILHNGQLYCGN